jgi:hypothetical protein
MKTKPSILILGIVGTAVLSLAAGAELKHTAPAKVDMAGLWKINPDLSDDPYEAVENKRRDSAGDSRTGGGPAGGRTGSRRGGIVIDAGDILDGVLGGGTVGGSTGGTVGGRRGGGGGGTSDRPAGDPEPSSMRVPLDSFLATLDQFEIAQKPDSLTIATVDETSTCKPADPGQAPLPGGELGERKCGWQGDTWVTEIKAPDGVTRTSRYELKKDGRQLVMTSEIKGGKAQLAGLRIKRVYDRVLMN